MNARLRQTLSALGIVAFAATMFAAAASAALAIRDAQASAEGLGAQLEALQAREARLAKQTGRVVAKSPLFEARTVTLAGAALQQRLEGAILGAKGRLVSTKVEVAPRGDEQRVSLLAELTIAEADLQALLFDLETGRPYLFVDAIEVRAPGQGAAMRVSLNVSGQWGGAK